MKVDVLRYSQTNATHTEYLYPHQMVKICRTMLPRMNNCLPLAFFVPLLFLLLLPTQKMINITQNDQHAAECSKTIRVYDIKLIYILPGSIHSIINSIKKYSFSGPTLCKYERQRPVYLLSMIYFMLHEFVCVC